MTISLPRCRKMATDLGLAVYQLPGSQSTMRRYAVVRGDGYTRSKIVIYRGIQALHRGLQAPQWTYPEEANEHHREA